MFIPTPSYPTPLPAYSNQSEPKGIWEFESASDRTYHLLVQYPGGQKQKYSFHADDLVNLGAVTMGSASDNNIVIRDSSVSRYHACFKMKHAGLQIKDLGSTNGTYLPQHRIRLGRNEGAILRIEDTIILGNVNIKLY